MNKYFGYTILAVIIIACFAGLYILSDIWNVLACIAGTAIGIGLGRLVMWLIEGRDGRE